MFVPLYDDNPLRSIRYPYVTVALIAINVVAFMLELTPAGQHAAASFAIVPAELFQVGLLGGSAHGPQDVVPVPEGLTLFTYMFLHGDPVHLVGNMLFLWVFGDNVEDALGHARYVVFYVVCGMVGGLLHALSAEFGTATLFMKSSGALDTPGRVPLIGASGAVAGSISAYLILHPRVRVWVLAFRFIPLRITAMLALGAWIATQFFMVLVPNIGPVAWWAHIGGIVTGALLVIFMRRPGVPLFDRPAPKPAV